MNKTPNSVIKGKVDKETALRLLWATRYQRCYEFYTDEEMKIMFNKQYEEAKDGDVLCEYKG